jgi:hypothetical protein
LRSVHVHRSLLAGALGSDVLLYPSKTCADVIGFTQTDGSKLADRNAFAGFFAPCP